VKGLDAPNSYGVRNLARTVTVSTTPSGSGTESDAPRFNSYRLPSLFRQTY
jgi:hypothetical protein